MIPVSGVRAVTEILRNNPDQVKEIWIARRSLSALEEILEIAEREGISINYKDYKELSLLVPNVNHQGIVAIVSDFRYKTLDELILHVKDLNEKPIIIALDHITDEGNFASIIRTSAFFGVNGIVIPKKRSVSVSAQVIKRSSGAYLYVPIVRVANMASALKRLSDEGFWIIGTSSRGNVSLYDFDWDRELVLVLGNEEKGISQPVENVCHEIVNIPVFGAIEALNVSVATGIFLSEIIRQRKT